MPIAPDVYRARRQRLMTQLGDAVAVLPTAPVRHRNGDADFAYRPDSDFVYLTGFTEPQAVLVLVGKLGRAFLFCQPKNPEMEIWEGFIWGPEAAAETFGFDAAYAVDQLPTQLMEWLADASAVYLPWGGDQPFDVQPHPIERVVREAQVQCRRKQRNAAALGTWHDVRPLVAEMRLRKDEHEVALMREAARISVAAHRRAMQTTRPGMMEYQVEAELIHEFMRHGARHPAYGSIVAGGRNATCLHYSENNQVLASGSLLLIDAGCEYEHYAADITRTFPVSGRFSGPQRAVYDVVLAAMEASFEQVRPGVPRIAYHDAAVRVLTQGLVDLGALKGDVDGLIEQGAYKTYYMHGTGHWLGLDVHDAGAYQHAGASRPLEPGMALTVEPGLYFRPGPGVPEALVDIGVRIEDDLLVTDAGHENLTAGAPKNAAEIEALMASA